MNSSPADEALKEVESLLMYGQLDLAVDTLEQAVLQYPQESQLYIMLFDLYERVEDWHVWNISYASCVNALSVCRKRLFWL